MSEQVVLKRDIAREYLDAAIEFYLAQTNVFCAILLAGAAEELLGKHLPEDQRIFNFAVRAENASTARRSAAAERAKRPFGSRAPTWRGLPWRDIGSPDAG